MPSSKLQTKILEPQDGPVDHGMFQIEVDVQSGKAASQAEPTEGTESIFFNFQPENLLGKGGFATVYRGFYQNRPVAVKRIELVRCKDDPTSQQEQSIMLNLNHRNVLKLVHWLDNRDFRCLILELCDGTLADYIQGNTKQFTVQSDEMNWLYQMACGVEHIHQNKLVHRDIKPQNVLISIEQDQRAVLKISDFGFCKPTSERGSYSQSGGKGTREYMAPEVLKCFTKLDEPITERGTIASDVFSLGCVFFNLVVKGLHPFGEDFFIVLNIIEGHADHMDLAGAHKTHGLIRSMIHHSPDQRPLITPIAAELHRLAN